jgi:hypothetical protein
VRSLFAFDSPWVFYNAFDRIVVDDAEFTVMDE